MYKAYTKPDICFVVGMVSKYQLDPGEEYWIMVKHIFKYLRRIRDYMLVYHDESLEPVGYTDSNFQSDIVPESLLQDMCSPLKVEPLVGGV